jgi:hypothetical protein
MGDGYPPIGGAVHVTTLVVEVAEPLVLGTGGGQPCHN